MTTNNLFTKLALGAVGAARIAACAPPLRNVPHLSGWSGDNNDYLYVAYTEDGTMSFVKLCRVQPNNTLACVDQPEVDKLLNPQ